MNNYFCTNSGYDCNCPPPQPPCQNCPPPQQQPCQNCPPQPCQEQQPQRSCCACGEDFRRALDLICSPRLQGLVDTTTFAFITDNYVLGTPIAAAPAGTTPADNLTAPAATYVCGGDNCESLTVSGTLYPTTVDGAALATIVTQVALCQLSAISFDASEALDGAEANFQTISQILGQRLRPQKPQECTSIVEALTSAAAVRASTLAVGPLVVQNSAILGRVGDVIVMANATDDRFYFICADKVEFMG